MSAFLVSDNHINFMVSFSLAAFRDDIDTYYSRTWEEPEKLGAMLHTANVRSVDYRYPQNAHEDPEAYTADVYRYKYTPGVSASVENIAKLFKALDCYEYQACEFPTWKESDAYALCQQIRNMAIRALPGYDAAPWGIP